MTTEATLVETAQQTERPAELDLDALIRELDAGMDRLPVAALRTCQRNRELVTPRLIEVLEEAARLAREGTARPGNAHFFAIFLLTEFQAKAALPVMLELYSLREPLLENVVSAVTETPRRVLAMLAGDQPDVIESMILNQQLDDYVRWEAATALCQLVRDERMSRAEALERLTRQMRIAVERKDHWGVTIVVSELGALNPLEMQNEIKAVFDQRMADESVVDWNCFPKFFLAPDQPGMCPQLADWEPGAISDTVEELSSWYCFSEEAQRAREAAPQKFIKSGEQPLSYYSDDVEHDDGIELLDEIDRNTPDIVTVRHEAPRVGRNDPCPCGSGKKYKKCCLRA